VRLLPRLVAPHSRPPHHSNLPSLSRHPQTPKKLLPPLLPHTTKNITTTTKSNHTKLADLAQFVAETKAVVHEAAAQNKAVLENFANATKAELAEEREEWGTEHNTAPGDLPLNKLVKKGLGRR
jgi:hypothetical protein